MVDSSWPPSKKDSAPAYFEIQYLFRAPLLFRCTPLSYHTAYACVTSQPYRTFRDTSQENHRNWDTKTTINIKKYDGNNCHARQTLRPRNTLSTQINVVLYWILLYCTYYHTRFDPRKKRALRPSCCVKSEIFCTTPAYEKRLSTVLLAIRLTYVSIRNRLTCTRRLPTTSAT